jgi:hypothetical protein
MIYNRVASGLVWSAMDGVNSTIFAYGQTSSGKTFTMRGNGVRCCLARRSAVLNPLPTEHTRLTEGLRPLCSPIQGSSH